MKFPLSEITQLNNRLDQDLYIYTIRVSSQYGKYKVNHSYKTNLKYSVTVINDQKLDNIEDYQFYDELTLDQLKQLEKYNTFHVLTLKKYKKSQ